MSGKILASVILFAFIAGQAWAEYESLLKEFNAYEPGAFYRAYTRPGPREKTSPRIEREFRNQVYRIKEMKAHWEKALEEGSKEQAFYKPDPSLFKTLEPGRIEAGVARAALADGFSLAELEVLALLRNQGVKAAEKEVRATLDSYGQAWNLDEILRQYSAFTEDLMTGIGPMKGREPVEMKFPFPGVLALKGEVVTQEAKASMESLEIARRSAVTAVRRAYWDLLFIKRAQEISKEMLSLMNRLESVAKTRYETGKTSFQDVIKITIERDILKEDVRTLQEREGNLLVKMLEILDLPPGTGMGDPSRLHPPTRVPRLDFLYSLGLEKKQEIRRLNAVIGKMEKMIEMAETKIYPHYSLNLSLYQDEAISQVGTWRKKEPFAVTTTSSVGAGLPKMPWYGTSDAYLREVRERLQALHSELQKVKDATLTQVREAWFRHDLAKRQERLYAKKVVNLSQAALEVSTRGYETGKVSFADVISSYTIWLKFHLALERHRSDLGVAHAGLEEAVGASWKEQGESLGDEKK